LTSSYTLRINQCVTTRDYQRALDAACREYEALTKQRAELDTRIAQLTQSIGNLTRLCGSAPTVPLGLTDACRMVLKAAGHPLTALEVRDQLEAMGMDLSKYSSELAAIHTILKRLRASGEVGFVPRGWDKPGYRWDGSRFQGQARQRRADKPARAVRKK
jgi:hypothetical protein